MIRINEVSKDKHNCLISIYIYIYKHFNKVNNLRKRPSTTGVAPYASENRYIPTQQFPSKSTSCWHSNHSPNKWCVTLTGTIYIYVYSKRSARQIVALFISENVLHLHPILIVYLTLRKALTNAKQNPPFAHSMKLHQNNHVGGYKICARGRNSL